MNKLSKIAGAAAAATLVAMSGTAFTATSTIPDAKAAVNVGSVSQAVSGVNVLEVTHDYTASTDTTNSVLVKVSETLDTTAGVMKVKVTANAVVSEKSCDAATNVAASTGVTAHSTVNCTISLADVENLQFIVNG